MSPPISRFSVSPRCFSVLDFASLAPASLALRADCGRLPRERPLSGGQRFRVSTRPPPHFSISDFQHFSVSSQGSSLITTLLVITVLTIIVVAFMTSMSIERRTSQSYANMERAKLAAESAFNEATLLVSGAISSNNWHGIGVKSLNNQLTPVLVGSPTPTASAPANEIYLISYDPAEATFNTTNSVDINLKDSESDNSGWIGSPVNISNQTITHRSATAHWVEILENNSLPNQPNPSQPNFNPVIARYAFWIDDETSKVDLRVAGNDSGSPAGAFARSQSGDEVSDLDIGALPLNNLSPLDYSTEDGRQINADIVAFQQTLEEIPVDMRALNRASDSLASSGELADQLNFHTTFFSLSNDLAMTGRRRANLNHIVTDSTDPDVIAADLDDIAFVITGQHVMQEAPAGGPGAHPNLENAAHSGMFLELPEETGPMPDFGDRFFIGSASGFSTELKRDIYLKKIAANIRDYIDADSLPTVIDETGSVLPMGRPTIAPSISEPNYQAMGVEAIPYLQEHAWRGFIEPGSWSQSGNTVTANLRIDHYFEIYNPSTKDFVAPNGAFIKVYDLPSWQAGSFPVLTPDDFEIDISNIVVPAGGVRVITTNDTGQHPPDLLPPELFPEINLPIASFSDDDTSKLIVGRAVPQSGVKINGAMSNQSFSEDSNSVRGFRLLGRTRPFEWDTRTRFLIGTSAGILMHFPSISLMPRVLTSSERRNSRFQFTSLGSNVGSQTRFVYTSSMRGNDNDSRSGDARSISEQLHWRDYLQSHLGGNGDQTRFFSSIVGHMSDVSKDPPKIPHTTTLGEVENQYIAPSNWPDYHVRLDGSPSSAFSVISNGHMLSTGELGHIYDPHRKPTNESSSDIRHARGGGRSLKIGQRDDLIPTTRFGTSGATTSWFNAAWRLCDLFAAEDPAMPVSTSSQPGRININGALRDNGVAIRAALREFVFLDSPDGDPARAGQKMTEAEIDDLVNEIITYLQTNGPMLERGELSQLPFFSDNSTAGGQDGLTAIDRSREEIFRRVVELITTRSLAFSIYCLGEAVRQKPSGEIETLGRSAVRKIVHLVPQAEIEGTDGSGNPITTTLDLDDTNVPPYARVSSFRVETIHENKLY